MRAELLGLPRPAARLLGDSGTGSWLTVGLPRPGGEAAVAARARQAGLGPVRLARYHGGEPGTSGLVLGCAGLREEGISRAARRLGTLLESAPFDSTQPVYEPMAPGRRASA
jgi:DNA-binding transcriptional MocR family regulator